MKLPTLVTCLALGAGIPALAQTAPNPLSPGDESAAGENHRSTFLPGVFRELDLQGGPLPSVVEQLQQAYSVAAPEARAAALAEAGKKSGLSDEVLVRRLYLDILGRAPSAREAQEFIQSADSQKRAKLVDQLVKELSLPTLIYGPGTGEALVAGGLHLVETKPLDALALIATAAGCTLQPIKAPPQDGEEKKLRIIGYGFFSGFDPANPSASQGYGEAGGAVELARVGVELAAKGDGNIVVSGIIPGSPADRIKIVKPGDRILRVSEEGKEDVDVTGLPAEKVADLIRGGPGTVVKLTLLSHNAGGETITHIVSLMREKVDPPKGKVTLQGNLNVAGDTYTGTTLVPNTFGSTDEYSAVTVPNVNVFGDGNGNITGLSKPNAKTDPGVPNPAVVASGLSAALKWTTTSPTTATSKSLPATSATSTPTPENDAPIVRIYALGAILSGDEEQMREKESNFETLVSDAISLADAKASSQPKLYFHVGSRVLVAKATAKQHDIIDQAISALKEIDKLTSIGKQEKETAPPSPKKP